MHPCFDELFAFMDEQHATLRRTYDAVPAERRDVRPQDDSWTVNEIITHLVMVDRRITALATRLIGEAKANGLAREADTSSRLARFPLPQILDRTRRIVGPPPVDPRNDGAVFGWDDFDAARSRLKDAFLAGEGLALGQIVAPHPALGPLDMYGWMAFCGAHAARHAAQIREIDASLGAQSGA